MKSDADEDASAILRTHALRVGYQGRALSGPFDLEIRAGELWAVAGRNGSGKSTWLRTLLGLLPPVSGRVEWAVARPSPVYVAQDSKLDSIYPVSVGSVVAMGAMRDLSFASLANPTLDVAGALEQVGLADLEHQSFRDLSAGQRQRVLFARAWAGARDLVVLDEPTSAMDGRAEQRAFELMKELASDRGIAVVVVGHDHGLLSRFADHALYFDQSPGRIAVGSAKDVLANAGATSAHEPA